MYRVVTTYRNGTDRPIVERGPWHPARQDAEHWAELLRQSGYVVSIESQRGHVAEDNSDLASALASMA